MLSIRGLRLYFPCTGGLGCAVCFAPPPLLPVYLCANVGSLGLLAAAWPAPFHNPLPRWTHQLRCHKSSLPRLPISAPPTGLDECLFFISLVSDFLALRFSVSSGCARRRSVSTYAAILVLLKTYIQTKVINTEKSSVPSSFTVFYYCSGT